MATENKLCTNRNIFLYDKNSRLYYDEQMDEINFIKENFCGKVVTKIDTNLYKDGTTIIYLYGDINYKLNKLRIDPKIIYVIKELSCYYESIESINVITLGQVPININNVGVLFRKFFDDDKKYFENLSKEHQFQSLTESNKLGKSYRKGIYITKVEENKEGFNFNLLRCSTNLDGPTDNFRHVDNDIINSVNHISQYLFEQKTDLNHVLAQKYNNTKVNGKEKKAKIKQHADKTKDMPRNGLMAFCTFYSFDKFNVKEIRNPKDDPYNCYYKNGSILTKLRFKLKAVVDDLSLVRIFDVTLYPNSVFMMSLDMNRLYTHEIIPSHLPIDKLPTRLGYVIRCSKTKALFKNNQTYIIDGDKYVQLEEPTSEGIKKLKLTYVKENISDELINYEKINFSLNQGDYTKPNV